jgi:putative oxidoreductase
VFVAALFLPSGFHKLTTFAAFSASLASKGLPYPTVLAAILVAAEVLGPLALLVGLDYNTLIPLSYKRWTT